MTAPIPFFDGHNDFLLRLIMTPARRQETWLGATGRGHLDLARMMEAGFSGGLFAIFVPPAPPRPSDHATAEKVGSEPKLRNAAWKKSECLLAVIYLRDDITRRFAKGSPGVTECAEKRASTSAVVLLRGRL